MKPQALLRWFSAVALLSAGTASASVSGDTARVLHELTRLEGKYGGHLGICAVNLATGEKIGYNAGERFPTASVIKLPVMATFFHLVESGKIDPAMKVVLTRDDKKDGSGVLQFLSDGTTITLLDAVKLMIILSDNTATNLVLDRIASSHPVRMALVNDFMLSQGLKNTRILNRLYSWETKQGTPEGIRYGIGVSTPEDMVTLLVRLHNKQLADSASCDAMLDILKDQFYSDMIPRYLPAERCKYLDVAHKTGDVSETKVDVGLVLSDRVKFSIAVFVDKSPDHSESSENEATLLGAHAARAVWNYFAGDSGYEDHSVNPRDVDWTRFPGGRWGIYRSPAAPFPHPARQNGFRTSDGTVYPYFPHYADSSIVVFVPDGFSETPEGANVIVHFHGHLNDNTGTLERYKIPQAMIAAKINALLILPEGPYHARDSFGGKMEDPGGFQRMVEDVMSTMNAEKVVASMKVNKILISAHSGGYRPAAFVLHSGGMTDHISAVFLFDAFYALQEYFRDWLLSGHGILKAAYTEHLEQEHLAFAHEIGNKAGNRFSMTKTDVDHDNVVQTFCPEWLLSLGKEWKMVPKP